MVKNALGSAELAGRQVLEAIEDFQERSICGPTTSMRTIIWGWRWTSGNDFSRAESEFRKAAELKPEDANAHANLGAALAQLGKFSDAKRELELALKLKPDSQLAQENLAALERVLTK